MFGRNTGKPLKGPTMGAHTILGNLISEPVELWLALLDERVAQFTLHGIAVSTTRNLKTHINAYVCFCTKYKLDPFPADTLQLCRYVAYLTDTHDSTDSIKNYVSGVCTLHMLMGFEAPAISEYLYQLTIKGIRCNKALVVWQAEPVTPEILVQCVRNVNAQEGKELTTWLAILVGFYVMVHKSNLVPTSAATFDASQQFTCGNIVKTHYGDEAWIYWSKTIQFHDRCLQLPILPNPDVRICPVFGWTCYLGQYLQPGINLPLGILTRAGIMS